MRRACGCVRAGARMRVRARTHARWQGAQGMHGLHGMRARTEMKDMVAAAVLEVLR